MKTKILLQFEILLAITSLPSYFVLLKPFLSTYLGTRLLLSSSKTRFYKIITIAHTHNLSDNSGLFFFHIGHEF